MHQDDKVFLTHASVLFRFVKTDRRGIPLPCGQSGQSNRSWFSISADAIITVFLHLYVSLPFRTEMLPVGLPWMAHGVPGTRLTHLVPVLAVPRHRPDRGTASRPI